MHIRDLRRLRPILDYKTACTMLNCSFQTRLLQFYFLQHRLFSNQTPANNPECSRPDSDKSILDIIAIGIITIDRLLFMTRCVDSVGFLSPDAPTATHMA